MIRLKGVTKRFGRKEALKGVSFTINGGEVLALLGHNGAGKTTTLRLITTILDPTEGTIERPTDFRAQLGFLPDEPFLFEYLTGREMLYFMASLYRVQPEAIEPRTDHYLELFEIGKAADQLIKTYSRGMRRKIALIGSLLHNPFYWLLDEPTESLDPVAVRNLKDLVANRKQEKRAVVLSTHQLALAEAVCDRLVILSQGSLVFDGSLAELRIRTGSASSLEDIYFHLHAGKVNAV